MVIRIIKAYSYNKSNTITLYTMIKIDIFEKINNCLIINTFKQFFHRSTCKIFPSCSHSSRICFSVRRH